MSEKKYEATEHRLRQIRTEQGRWYVSKELTASTVTSVTAGFLVFGMSLISRRFLRIADLLWQPERLASADPLRQLDASVRQASSELGVIVAALLVSVFAASLLIGLLQTGGFFTMKRLANWQQINPASGFRNIFFTAKTYKQLAMNIVKAAIIAGLVVVVVGRSTGDLLQSVRLGPIHTSRVFQDVLLSFLWYACTLYAVFGMADYWIERHAFYKNARMNEQEQKDDQKEANGNAEARWKFRMVALMMRLAEEEKQSTGQAASPFMKMLGRS